jgi:hypothetical protein
VHVRIAIFANGREVYNSANRPGRVGQCDLLAMQLLDRTLDFDGLILCAMDEREAGNYALRGRAIFGEWIRGRQGGVRVKDGLAVCVVACDDTASCWE